MPKFVLKDKDAESFQALDEFTQGYIEAIFFTENSYRDTKDWLAHCEDGTNGGPLPNDVSWLDFAPEALESIKKDCAAFQEKNRALLELAAKISCYGYEMNQAGHDFWFSRNGHGTGFFDRGLQQAGDQLQEACGWRTDFPEVNVYFGDDGLIHLS